MTSTERSRQWAETMLIYLNEASKAYRYWAALYDEVEPMNGIKVLLNYGRSKDQIRLRRDQELDKFINRH